MIRSTLVAIATTLALVAPAAAIAADDPPFNGKSVIDIPVSATIMDDNAGEMVAITGSITGKAQIAYKGGSTARLKLKLAATDMVGVGQTSGDVYRYKAKNTYKSLVGTTISEIDVEIQAMQGDPIPGLDVKIGKNPGGALVAVHLDVNPTGQVTGSTATASALPTPASATPINLLQITN
jgi:hypothetical protein